MGSSPKITDSLFFDGQLERDEKAAVEDVDDRIPTASVALAAASWIRPSFVLGRLVFLEEVFDKARSATLKYDLKTSSFRLATFPSLARISSWSAKYASKARRSWFFWISFSIVPESVSPGPCC